MNKKEREELIHDEIILDKFVKETNLDKELIIKYIKDLKNYPETNSIASLGLEVERREGGVVKIKYIAKSIVIDYNSLNLR